MSSIRTYKDLMQEQTRLELLLDSQRQQVHQRLDKRIRPVKKVLHFVKRMFALDETNSLLDVGVEVAVVKLLRRLYSSHANWFVKLTVPFFLRNLVSTFLKETLGSILEKMGQSAEKNKEEAEKATPGETATSQ